jgi:hypothetical protein
VGAHAKPKCEDGRTDKVEASVFHVFILDLELRLVFDTLPFSPGETTCPLETEMLEAQVCSRKKNPDLVLVATPVLQGPNQSTR